MISPVVATEDPNGLVYKEGFLQCLSIVAPLLDGRDAARLSQVNWASYTAVRCCPHLVRRMKQHYIYLEDYSKLSTLLPDDLEFVCNRPGSLGLPIALPVEGVEVYSSRHTGRKYVLSNHYEEHSHFLDSFWDTFGERYAEISSHLLVEFPVIPGSCRFRLGEWTVWRGGVVIMRLSAPEEPERKLRRIAEALKTHGRCYKTFDIIEDIIQPYMNDDDDEEEEEEEEEDHPWQSFSLQ